ncbi:MAG: hypothetical protein GXW89_07420 [Phycisphaerae bacterium]|nr:hypothetical protein [Phycisphaerae bacterium]
MKLSRIVGIAMLVATMPAAPAAALVEMYLKDGQGDPKQVQIAPGESFTVQLGIGLLEDVVGISCWLTISDNGSGKFWLTDRVVDPACPYSDLNTSNRDLLAAENALLDPYNERCLGGIAESFPNNPPLGIYPIAMITIASSPDVPPGVYTLSTIGQSGSRFVGDPSKADVEEVEIAGSSYTVVVVADGGGGVDPDEGEPGDGGSGDGGTGDDSVDDQTDNPQDDSSVDDDRSGGGSNEEGKHNRVPIGCGAGVGGVAGMVALLCLGLIRPTFRRG